jgi:2-keto-4-pentenoate hydratase
MRGRVSPRSSRRESRSSTDTNQDAWPEGLSDRGRSIYGPTPPGQGRPCARQSPLTSAEVDEAASLIAGGRRSRHAVELPGPLRTRDWPSVVAVLLAVDHKLGLAGAGWKVGAASEEIRRAEGLPSPSPGVIYAHTIFPSGSLLPDSLFINYRNCECEFAFRLNRDFAVRAEPYTEADALAGIETLFPVLEVGDCVFADWYGASGYFGSCLDNGGGAALVTGPETRGWQDAALPRAGMDAYLNGHYIKSGLARAAMGHPVTSLTWMLNWAREHGRAVRAGDVVSTGTCTGHLFAAPGDTVRADFGAFGVVEATFA